MLVFNIICYIDFASTDQISETVSYSVIANHIQEFTEKETKIKTLEALADKIALDCLNFGIEKVMVKIEKTQALLHSDTVGIEIMREKKHMPYLQGVRGSESPTTEDVIFIKDLLLTCIIGVNACERIDKQKIYINLKLHYLPPTLVNPKNITPERNNYVIVAKKVTSFIDKSRYKTLEMMAVDLSNVILYQCDVDKVSIRIEKPSALMFAETAGVEIVREKNENHYSHGQDSKQGVAFLAIGTNLGDRVKNIELALHYLKNVGISILDTSFLYETKPMYVLDQPNFLNAALKVFLF
jgi:dihydroneopterin aldolase/2-amino-4-hydroxy-6-hydroxymethyldihydropteridine diphosphokinase/dihydropteroate synthase/2-amino-4-hydroxy-6-hydroxymethyldihydropteridine diphosphokinase/dihydropteroate synthase